MKVGFVSIVGRPNVGKSTLLNRILKTHLAITSDKVGTTRNNILGVYNDSSSQIIFVDTPGIAKANDKLGEVLNSLAYSSFSNDLVLFLVDIASGFGPNDKKILEKLKQDDQKVILVLNKIDLIKKEELFRKILELKDLYNFTDIVPISSIKNDNVDELLKVIKDNLLEGEKLFEEDFFTNINEKYYVSEIIREKVLNLTRQEVPHSVSCYVLKMEFSKEKIIITATIVVDRDNLKGIIIGKNGRMLKEIGTEARKDLENYYNKKVYLDLFVKVIEDWRSKESVIKELLNLEDD
ncbi:MAG: GTPase Era [bacterium]|nr:GTPase Era [bacterium]